MHRIARFPLEMSAINAVVGLQMTDDLFNGLPPLE
jgi:hypothetical protein